MTDDQTLADEAERKACMHRATADAHAADVYLVKADRAFEQWDGSSARPTKIENADPER